MHVKSVEEGGQDVLYLRWKPLAQGMEAFYWVISQVTYLIPRSSIGNSTYVTK